VAEVAAALVVLGVVAPALTKLEVVALVLVVVLEFDKCFLPLV
jgi:hypothetical protein